MHNINHYERICNVGIIKDNSRITNSKELNAYKHCLHC